MKNLNRKSSWERTYSQMAKEKEDWQDFDITMVDGIEIDEIASEMNESPRRKRTGYLNSFLPNILTPQSGGVFTLFVQ